MNASLFSAGSLTGHLKMRFASTLRHKYAWLGLSALFSPLYITMVLSCGGAISANHMLFPLVKSTTSKSPVTAAAEVLYSCPVAIEQASNDFISPPESDWMLTIAEQHNTNVSISDGFFYDNRKPMDRVTRKQFQNIHHPAESFRSLSRRTNTFGGTWRPAADNRSRNGAAVCNDKTADAAIQPKGILIAQHDRIKSFQQRGVQKLQPSSAKVLRPFRRESELIETSKEAPGAPKLPTPVMYKETDVRSIAAFEPAEPESTVETADLHQDIIEDSPSERNVLMQNVEDELADSSPGGVVDPPKDEDASCGRDTRITCKIFACSVWHGPTLCVNGRCLCQAGYCVDSQGVCRGCSHLSIEVHEVPVQADKSGYYSAIHGFHAARRAVWKQFHGGNWLWYCESHSCWVLSEVAPNDTNCDAGIVSPSSSITVSPFDLNSPWKVWDGFQWIDDWGDNRHVRLRCQDNLPHGGLNFSALSMPQHHGNSGTEVITFN